MNLNDLSDGELEMEHVVITHSGSVYHKPKLKETMTKPEGYGSEFRSCIMYTDECNSGFQTALTPISAAKAMGLRPCRKCNWEDGEGEIEESGIAEFI